MTILTLFSKARIIFYTLMRKINKKYNSDFIIFFLLHVLTFPQFFYCIVTFSAKSSFVCKRHFLPHVNDDSPRSYCHSVIFIVLCCNLSHAHIRLTTQYALECDDPYPFFKSANYILHTHA